MVAIPYHLKSFKQITMKFHGIYDDSFGCPFNTKLECFDKINQTHYIIHAHGNNWGTILDNITNVIELTFLRKSEFNSEPILNNQILPIVGIDFPNNPTKL